MVQVGMSFGVMALQGQLLSWLKTRGIGAPHPFFGLLDHLR